MTPGTLIVTIDDRALHIDSVGGGAHTLAVGPLTLLAGPLSDGDPPPPASLTNALGLVHDHLNDLFIEVPSMEASAQVVAIGLYAEAMARVEIGADVIPVGYELVRADAEEVFRMLAVEPLDDRRHNPGLPDMHVESIIATCCVILAIMRRLDLHAIEIRLATSQPDERPAER